MHKQSSSTFAIFSGLAAVGLVLFLLTARDVVAQKTDKPEIGLGRNVLRNVKSAFKNNYYDPTFHGMNVDERFRQADEKLKQARTNGQMWGIIAQVLLDLNDSHTDFIPPLYNVGVDYNWRMKAVGDDCYVGAVRPGSDADIKGLKAGDKVISIDGRPMDRSKIWLAKYLYYDLRPQPVMSLVIQKPDGRQQQVAIDARVQSMDDIMRDFHAKDNHLRRHRFYEASDEVLIWKMPKFDLSEQEVDSRIGKFRKRQALILDLRGNSGGYVDTLERLLGYFFAGDVKVADRVGRKQMKPIIAKGHRDNAFKGQLIVLVDGESASAAEVFARVIQLEKRGTVIGDRSEGAVMESIYYPLEIGITGVISFGINVTEADLIMTDGKSLEHVGVTPDELLLPTTEDLAANRDPVLAHAASLVGVKLDPVKAGALFPIEWRNR